MSQATVSIVMPCLDGMPHLPRAIESARDVFPRGVAQIVVADGGSRDGSLEYLRSQDLTLLEGPDASLYEGVNRAIAAARGEYVFWLNSDDVLTGAAAKLLTVAVETGAELATGEAEISGPGRRTAWRSDNAAREITSESVLFGVPTINSRLMAMPLVRQTGAFRTDIGVAADRHFLLRLLRCRPRRVSVPEVVYQYRSHPQSLTIGDSWRTYRSVHQAHAALADALRSDMSTLPEAALMDAFEFTSRLASARALLFCGHLDGAIREGMSSLARQPNPLRWRHALARYRRHRGHGSGW